MPLHFPFFPSAPLSFPSSPFLILLAFPLPLPLSSFPLFPSPLPLPFLPPSSLPLLPLPLPSFPYLSHPFLLSFSHPFYLTPPQKGVLRRRPWTAAPAPPTPSPRASAYTKGRRPRRMTHLGPGFDPGIGRTALLRAHAVPNRCFSCRSAWPTDARAASEPPADAAGRGCVAAVCPRRDMGRGRTSAGASEAPITMPMVRPAGPPEPRNHARVVRTESLKSERSDKRVSFNKDVGVKHIPRGQKQQQIKNNLVRAPQEDEWAHCAAVHREPVNLSSRELEQQAEDLVKLLDHGARARCPRAHRQPHQPPRQGRRQPRRAPLPLPPAQRRPARAPPPLGRPPAGLRPGLTPARAPPAPPGRPQVRARPQRRLLRQQRGAVVQVPAPGGARPGPRIGYKSIDALYERDEHGAKLNRAQSAGYKSVDNLTEHSQVGGGRLQGFKSVGHLPSTTLSDSDDADMSRPKPYKNKVGNIIKKFNAESDGTRHSNVLLETEMDVSPRGTLEPDRFRNHNNNQPFSYTGSLPMATVQTVRRLSPTRDLPPRASPPRDSPPRDAPVYAQVNKKDARDAERNYRNARQEREYSAKIIITDDDHRPFQDPYDDHFRDAKNHYQEDDDAYESYQVPEDNIKRLLHEDIMPARMLSSEDLLEEYKEQSNNNINMSSVGVQTDALPKAPSSASRTITELEAPPAGGNIHNNLTSATLVRQVNHGFGRTDRSPSPPLRRPQTRQPRRNVVPLLSTRPTPRPSTDGARWTRWPESETR
ncbi:hypothetical protein C7M84_008694 [Penaeus vannamei]|uniref:Uncharacterized protein n=1 Tax=Penaeus vannamei TaxID=6689 RepID=A0A3R7SSC9_PENVA|nr:hypothetical protein C7M84_008694 [Penaeus vannamei]